MTSLGRHYGDTENENVNTQMSVVFMNFLNICLQKFPHQKCNFGKPLNSFLGKDERTDMCFNSIGAYSLLVGDGVKVLENIPWIIHTALNSFLGKDERTDMCFNSIGAYSLLVGDGVKVLENIPWIIHTARS